MSKYLYNGALSEQTARSCTSMMREHPWPIEFARIPNTDALPEHKFSVPGDYGDEYEERVSKLYGIVHKNFGALEDGVFFFAHDRAEHQLMLEKNRDIVVNAAPFQTVLES